MHPHLPTSIVGVWAAKKLMSDSKKATFSTVFGVMALWCLLPGLTAGQSGSYGACDQIEADYCSSTIPCIWMEGACREDPCRLHWNQVECSSGREECDWRSVGLGISYSQCLGRDSPTPCHMYLGGSEECAGSGRCRLIGEGVGVST